MLIGEAAVFLGLAIVLSRHRDVRATFAALRPGHRLLVVLFPALLVAGHVVNREDRTFPFLSWELFTFSLRVDPTYHEYTAILASGREVVLPLLDLFPSFGRRLPSSLENASWQELHRRRSPRDVSRLRVALAALAREHDRRHAGDPVTAVDVWHRAVPREAYRGRASITRQHELRVELR